MTTPTAATASTLTGVTVHETSSTRDGYVAFVSDRTDAARFVAAVAIAFAADPDAATVLDGFDVAQDGELHVSVRVRISRA